MNFIKHMKPGSKGYTVPWAIFKDQSDGYSINGDYGLHSRGGTVQMLVIRQKNGDYIVDIDNCDFSEWKPNPNWDKSGITIQRVKNKGEVIWTRSKTPPQNLGNEAIIEEGEQKVLAAYNRYEDVVTGTIELYSGNKELLVEKVDEGKFEIMPFVPKGVSLRRDIELAESEVREGSSVYAVAKSYGLYPETITSYIYYQKELNRREYENKVTKESDSDTEMLLDFGAFIGMPVFVSLGMTCVISAFLVWSTSMLASIMFLFLLPVFVYWLNVCVSRVTRSLNG